MTYEAYKEMRGFIETYMQILYDNHPFVNGIRYKSNESSEYETVDDYGNLVTKSDWVIRYNALEKFENFLDFNLFKEYESKYNKEREEYCVVISELFTHLPFKLYLKSMYEDSNHLIGVEIHNTLYLFSIDRNPKCIDVEINTQNMYKESFKQAIAFIKDKYFILEDYCLNKINAIILLNLLATQKKGENE